MSKKTYVSIGSDCGTASILKSLGLRECSMPFDWVVTYRGVAQITKTGFNDYLTNPGVLFLHGKDEETMNRRMERFKNLLRTTTDKIIFVRKGHMDHHHGEHDVIENDVNDAIELNKVLKEINPELKYEIHIFLMCHRCFHDSQQTVTCSEPEVKLHHIARPTDQSVNLTNPWYFNEKCTQLFGKQ